ncbi:hypothetical protein M407DRAFT_128896 [Tulasnella calospora MUT 4182]|uniref:Uncharacterized protein n=1 Tax=Tulasnella calospora MUT 4182 TaxID=1051891 RepID=A0A0C3LCI4_9AGAM|nr:hypothetical protein M407DRAFT_128896 [Tulasnella calospora MUT 4182]
MFSRISRSATGLFSPSPSGRINEYKISEKQPVVDIVAAPEAITILEEPSPTVAVHGLEEEPVVEPTPMPEPEPTALPAPATAESEVEAAREPTPASIDPVPTPSPSVMQVAPEKSEKLAPVDPAPHDVTPYSDAKHIPYPPLDDIRPESPFSQSSGPTNPSAVSTFAAGAATTTAQKAVNETLHRRAATAENVLTSEEKAKIEKTEARDAKQLSKIIQNEGKVEDRLLKTSIKELARVQKIQKAAAAEEASAITAHAKAVRLEQKLNKAYLEAKSKWESAVVDLKSKEEKLASAREHGQTQTALVKEKLLEVEALRAQKATDDRERQAKLASLKNPALTGTAL